jgi:3-isopropylmalate/(R)-2-methylmalate dehydratase small subunit
MPLELITSVAGRAVPVPGNDVDTDRIIPARFMKCVTFDGLGQYLFYDVRFDPDGRPKGHPLDDPRHKGATILVTGNNFGCGSSREHAPQSLYRFGIRAVIAESYAEIFFGNSTTLGMPCVTVSHADSQALQQLAASQPDAAFTIDLVKKEIRAAGKTFPCDMRESARSALLNGTWDPIADLLDAAPLVDATASRLPYLQRA